VNGTVFRRALAAHIYETEDIIRSPLERVNMVYALGPHIYELWNIIGSPLGCSYCAACTAHTSLGNWSYHQQPSSVRCCGTCTGSTYIGNWRYNWQPSRVLTLCCTHIFRKLQVSSKRPLDAYTVLAGLQALGARL